MLFYAFKGISHTVKYKLVPFIRKSLDPKALCIFLTWELVIQKYIFNPHQNFFIHLTSINDRNQKPLELDFVELVELEHDFVRHYCSGYPEGYIVWCEWTSFNNQCS